MKASVSGIVLAGGSGTRLGADKALLKFGERTLLEIVVERLSRLTGDVVVACGAGTRAGWPGADARTVTDRVAGRGPLAGVDAGLRAIAAEAAIVVACDMPFLNAALLSHMVDCLAGHEVVVPEIDGRLHPLHGVYSKRCLPAVETMLQRGASMRDLLAAVDTKAMSEDELRAIDPDALSCFNLNSPADLERARTLWGQGRQEEAPAG